MRLLDGSRLSDPIHADYVFWCRRLIASLMFAPSDGISPSPGSMNNFTVGIKWLVSWMVRNSIRFPHELSPAVISQYLEDLPLMLVEEAEDESIGESQVWRALFLLDPLWRQRKVLEKLGVRAISHSPTIVNDLGRAVKQIANKPPGWIQPLPDEVAIPIFNKAWWLLGVPADDVLRLIEVVDDLGALELNWVASGNAYTRPKFRLPGQGMVLRRRRARTFCEEFKFGVPAGDSSPWHPRLDNSFESSMGITVPHRLRQLFEAIRDACAITIQGTSGMRISELLGIKAGIDPKSSLPFGVRVEKSITGLYEWFLIRTELSKTENTPRDVDWILGMRPLGSKEVPPAVRALEILNKLYAPWRKRAKTDQLFLSPNRGGHFLPLRTTALDRMESAKFADSLKRFLHRWVDLTGLPDESQHKTSDNDLVRWRESGGEIFSTHMLRKSWANYVLAVDPRLLPAIQMQFHHISLAMTEGGYIGRNPLLVEALDSVSRQQRNLLIFETVMGKAKLAGRMGEQLEHATEELKREVESLPTSDAWRKIVSYCDGMDLRIFFSPHGKCCPTRTAEMRCHNEAGTSFWIRNEPNYNTREPSLCAGCACFVLDARHKEFWEERYLQNWVSYKKAEVAGTNEQFRVMKERAEQAGRLLAKIGVTPEMLDQRLAEAMEANNGTP